MAEALYGVGRSRWVELTANAVYGTILTEATISVVSEKVYDDPIQLSLKVLATLVVFWLAHTFALGMAEGAIPGGTDRRTIGDQMINTSPMVVAAVPLLLPLFLAEASVFSTDAGLWISYGLATAILAGWGYVIARSRGLGTARTLRLMSITGILGLLLITLKEVVH
jgi:hypothetical protein